MYKDKLTLRNKKIQFYFLIFILSIIIISLIYLPANFFDTGQSICLSVLFFNKKCYGCGMTRAFQHLIHLDFKKAFEYNKLSFIVFPLLIVLILLELKKRFNNIKS